jgi:hypothetical protein
MRPVTTFLVVSPNEWLIDRDAIAAYNNQPAIQFAETTINFITAETVKQYNDLKEEALKNPLKTIEQMRKDYYESFMKNCRSYMMAIVV